MSITSENKQEETPDDLNQAMVHKEGCGYVPLYIKTEDGLQPVYSYSPVSPYESRGHFQYAVKYQYESEYNYSPYYSYNAYYEFFPQYGYGYDSQYGYDHYYGYGYDSQYGYVPRYGYSPLPLSQYNNSTGTRSQSTPFFTYSREGGIKPLFIEDHTDRELGSPLIAGDRNSNCPPRRVEQEPNGKIKEPVFSYSPKKEKKTKNKKKKKKKKTKNKNKKKKNGLMFKIKGFLNW